MGSSPRIPGAFNDISPDWLTRALRSSGRSRTAEVEAVSIERIGEGRGFAGSIGRLRIRYAGDSDAPSTLVVKLPSVDPDIRLYAIRDGMYRRETMFYRELAPESGVRIPYCYFADLDDDSGDFVLLLEDLAGLREGNEIAGCSLEDAALTVRYLARLHAAWWNDARVAELGWLTGDGDSSPGLQVLYRDAWNGAADSLASIFPPEVFAIAERFGPRLAAFLKTSDAGNRTLNHGDCHLGNMFFQDGEVVMIDWQNVMMTSPVLDVAYFIQGSLPVKTRRAHEVQLLDAYRETLMEHGVSDFSKEQLADHYRRGLLRTLIPSVLSVANLDMEGPDTRQLVETIGRRMIGIADWDCGDLIPN